MLYIFFTFLDVLSITDNKRDCSTTQLFQGQVTAKLLSCPVEEPDKEALSTRAFLYPLP